MVIRNRLLSSSLAMVATLLELLLATVAVYLTPYTPHKEKTKEENYAYQHTHREIVALNSRPHLKHLICAVARVVHHGAAVDNRA